MLGEEFAPPSSREARKESRSLGIFKGVSKSAEPTTTTTIPTPPQQFQKPPLVAPTSQPPTELQVVPILNDRSLLSPESAEQGPVMVPTTKAPHIEKTTKTTATYYPKLSRSDSLGPRKESLIIKDPPVPRKEQSPSITPAGALKSLAAGYESDSGDEFGPTDWGNSHQTVALKPYSHQVGGHSALFKFSRHAVCKPLVEKENAFYQDIEINRPECNSPQLNDDRLHRHVLPFPVFYELLRPDGLANCSTTVYAEVYRHVERDAPRYRDDGRNYTSIPAQPLPK